jgi:hypothetical protein
MPVPDVHCKEPPGLQGAVPVYSLPCLPSLNPNPHTLTQPALPLLPLCCTPSQVMRASGLPYTTPWAAGRLIRRWDAAWATWRERLRASRQRRAEAALQRRLRALGLGEGAR